eukprot:g3545.t1
MRRNEYIDSAGLRKDGRRPHEVRRIKYEFGPVEHADGSVHFEQGLTSVLVAVYGPRVSDRKAITDSMKATVTCEFRSVPFSSANHKAKRQYVDSRSAEMAKTICQSLEVALITNLYPRSQIKIILHCLRSDGGVLCACMNAATLALVDAGIPMKDFVVACTSGYLGDTFVRDLNNVEEMSRKPYLPLAMLPRSEKIVMVKLKSKIAPENFENLVRQAKRGCADIHKILQNAAKERVSASPTSAADETPGLRAP